MNEYKCLMRYLHSDCLSKVNKIKQSDKYPGKRIDEILPLGG